jgi:hypothetical protein
MSMTYLQVGALLALLAALGFFFLFRRLVSPRRDQGANLDWCNQFSVAKYRPMERLFSDADYEFLAAQPGYSRRITRTLQAERRRIFRHYLRSLSRDFDRLHRAAGFLLLHSPQDRPDLVSALLKQKLIFRYALVSVYCGLALQSLGIGKVDVRGLVRPVEALREQLRQLNSAVEHPVVA